MSSCSAWPGSSRHCTAKWTRHSSTNLLTSSQSCRFAMLRYASLEPLGMSSPMPWTRPKSRDWSKTCAAVRFRGSSQGSSNLRTCEPPCIAAWPCVEAQVGSKNWRPLYRGLKLTLALTCLVCQTLSLSTWLFCPCQGGRRRHPRQRRSSRTRCRACALSVDS